MREIKFRGKRKDSSQWITGYFLKDEITGQCFIFALGNSANESEKVGEDGYLRFFAFEVEEDTICQYTGLKDKNGKEIYEGDIYHQGDRNILYIVVWHDTGFIGKQAKASSYAGLEFWKDRIEVIGNIYENPDLLEVAHEN